MYRQEASESRIRGFSNPVSIQGSLAVNLMLGGIFIVALGFFIFGSLTDYTRRSIAPGFLRPDSGSVAISATRTGLLSLEVTDGELVSKGQRLAILGGIGTSLDGTPLIELELQNLQDAKGLIERRIALTRSQIEPLETQELLALEQHDRDIEAAERLVATRTDQLTFANEQFERTSNLLRDGVVTSSSLDEAQQSLLLAEQELENAKAQLERLEAQTQQVQIDWQTRRVELDQSINAFVRELRGIEAQIGQLESQRETGIFAPFSGFLTYSSAQEGEVVNDGAVLFQITPENSNLEAIVLAPSSAIGFVGEGNEIQLRYAAFPYREHGVFTGRVISIDETAQLPSAIRAPIQVAEPVYRLFVEIDQVPKSKNGEALNLASGMTFEASIIIDQKPLLLWLLDPIL